ncbi:hypothetical protein KA047_01115, partial [Candidatus Saccharibacteria bacterium]|nr:hypothetical protein [Candidatus Saccharibacteria bacterium]
MQLNFRHLKETRRDVLALLLLVVAVCSCLMLSPRLVKAHVEVEGDAYADSVEHARGNLGNNQSKRTWADSLYCRTTVDRIILPTTNGKPRAVYKFKTWVNANARGHAFEAGAFADSTQSHCQDDNNNAWNGSRVNLDDDMFKVGGKKPSNVMVGVDSTDEAQPGVRDSVAAYGFDAGVRLAHGIDFSSQGGAYGWTGDAAGYKINGQAIWCAGIDIGPINNPYAPGVNTNVRWPGWYWGNCSGGSFLFRAGSTSTGNFDTNWGSYTIGAMKNGQTETGVRCGCAIGSTIPGISRTSGEVNDFDLEAAGILVHDGVGTYNGGTGVPPGFNGSADDAAAARGNPYTIPVSEAWVTMEWDAVTRGGVQVTKYPSSSGPDASGHATGPIANSATSPGNRNICINPSIGCGTSNPFTAFNSITALPGGWYEIDMSAPSGFNISAVRYIYGTNFSQPYGSLTDPDGDGKYQVYIGGGGGANATLYLDVYYEPEAPSTLSCSIELAPESPEANQGFHVWLRYGYTGTRAVQARGNVALNGTSPTLNRAYGPLALAPGASGRIRMTTTPVSGPVGDYTVNANIQKTDGGLNFNCPRTFQIAAKPYFKVWANDVQVGGTYKNSSGQCNASEGNPLATVIAYGGSQGDDPPGSNDFRGASAEYAVFALGEVRNYISAGRRSPRTATASQWPTPPHGLTFANARIDPSIPAGDPGDPNKVVNYGGGSAIRHCADNWVDASKIPGDATVLASNFSFINFDLNNFNDAVELKRNSGTVRVKGSTNRSRSVFVLNENVDVVIDGNIAASNGKTVYIIAAGNIKIAKGVNYINAVLISKKRIITSTEDDGSLIPKNQLYNQCGGNDPDRKLVIRGAV